MSASDNQRRFHAEILFGIVYLVVGVTFPSIANSSASNEMRLMWRLAAWLASAAAFAVHIWYEHIRVRSSPRSTALHASAGVALGAFALAVAANIHALWANTSNHRSLALALVIWPIMTAVPTFVVALAIAAGLARTRPKL
jgi:hypothetical protein